MEIFDKGSSITVEIEFKKKVAFGSFVYFDPTSPLITITDSAGNIKIGPVSLEKSTVGKYFYICQTAIDWISGVYSGVATGVDGAYSDVTLNEDLFRLK